MIWISSADKQQGDTVMSYDIECWPYTKRGCKYHIVATQNTKDSKIHKDNKNTLGK